MNINYINSTHNNAERGNAMIYVLIAIVLFAALNLVLTRGGDGNEAALLSAESAEIYSTEIIGYSSQARSALQQMLFTGSTIAGLDFVRVGAAAFNTGSNINKIHHPEGGGLTLASLPDQAIAQTSADPVAGWYIGRFNNVEWTNDTEDDVILVAHQINKTVCEKINEKAIGSTTIPDLSGVTLADVFIDAIYHGGTNQDFDIIDCAACEDIAEMCVSNAAGTTFSYYSIVSAQ